MCGCCASFCLVCCAAIGTGRAEREPWGRCIFFVGQGHRGSGTETERKSELLQWCVAELVECSGEWNQNNI